MSRSQESQAFNTASGQNQTFNNDAQTAFNQAQGDIGDYQDQVAKYAAANPYTPGGQYQTTSNQIASNTANAAAQSAGQAMQAAAVRGGQNAGSSIAATEATEQANERAVAGQEAQANQTRLGQQASYNDSVVKASAVPEQMEAGLASEQANAGNTALGTEEKAGEDPSFLESLNQGLLNAGAAFAGGAGKAAGAGCWIAAELYGGWDDKRTILMRQWLASEVSKSWAGRMLLRAYTRWGLEMAKRIRTQRRLRAVFQRIFDAGLKRARAWDAREMARWKANLERNPTGHAQREAAIHG